MKAGWFQLAVFSFAWGASMDGLEVAVADGGNEPALQILKDHCTECHGSDSQESRLRLDSLEGAIRGGDFGPAILPGDATNSELVRRVTSRNQEQRMPPDGPGLTVLQIETLRTWVDSLPKGMTLESASAPLDPSIHNHWAWQPIADPVVGAFPQPNRAEEAGDKAVEIDRNPIDIFVRTTLRHRGLPLSPPADRRTLARRLSFDLCGLPPDPEELQQFLVDEAPDAYEQHVDRLLNSPAYGERWARHWLDIVHYGDTHGYDKDKPRPNAWRYRDYVIQSFNQDKPYAQFVREQIAGDALEPIRAEGVIATGFLAAGPWDFIGHEEVPETKTDGKIARHLDRDDMVANSIGTFCSITVHCAQCHHHKFDPIGQDDYYALQSVFAGVDRQDRSIHTDDGRMQQAIELEVALQKARREAAEAQRAIESVAADDWKKWENLQKASNAGSLEQGGYHSQIASSRESEKWVQIDLDRSQTISAVVLHPCYDDFQSIGAGFGFPECYRVEASNDPMFQTEVNLLHKDQSEDGPHRSTTPIVFHANVAAQYVRVTATRLAHRKDDFIFALAEAEVLDSSGENLAVNQTVTALDSIDAPPRWSQMNLVDCKSPGLREKNTREEIASLESKLRARVAPELWDKLMDRRSESQRLAATLQSFSNSEKVYAVSSAKRIGIPRPIFVLSRGNVNAPGREVRPGALKLIPTLGNVFHLESPEREETRRLALAEWISDRKNMLTWRSIANRVWQYHFGTGIVATANDFGRMGALPTHPELLDWLASRLQESDGSIKDLHRWIVCSATYRQASRPTEEHIAADSTNQYLGSYRRQRLDAESIRDSILSVSGTLNRSMGGPGWQDFVMERPEHSPHYRYDLANPREPSTRRRSIYRFIVRSQTQPWLTSLDCADPSMRVEKRNESQSAVQSLALLNNPFILAQSEAFAERVRREANGRERAEVSIAFKLALGRAPETEEYEVLERLRADAGLENVCRTLFNLNEFLFLD
ncbi:Planctomycete cytochrome C [Pirellula sp. SH-Sr6A]|uniref:DUF1553 domain-containing protein n=1 Tax=Pirellula sp. SH-Sr6A TaxID=1632865 RepID=UPI00078CEA9E|nr:DUF1553 domain-containing protein [Pirellula sp. SH-Sr6A]AMV32177.1 Planctomycete cytochrome C [Pirellula sp. SH-Sr6A]